MAFTGDDYYFYHQSPQGSVQEDCRADQGWSWSSQRCQLPKDPATLNFPKVARVIVPVIDSDEETSSSDSESDMDTDDETVTRARHQKTNKLSKQDGGSQDQDPTRQSGTRRRRGRSTGSRVSIQSKESPQRKIVSQKRRLGDDDIENNEDDCVIVYNHVKRTAMSEVDLDSILQQMSSSQFGLHRRQEGVGQDKSAVHLKL